MDAKGRSADDDLAGDPSAEHRRRQTHGGVESILLVIQGGKTDDTIVFIVFRTVLCGVRGNNHLRQQEQDGSNLQQPLVLSDAHHSRILHESKAE